MDAKSERMPIFLIFVCYDYLISTDSYVHVGVCVGNRSHRHDADSRKIGQHNRMLPTCWDDIPNMSVTDTNVCRLRGVADRHICRHCQPSQRQPCPTPSAEAPREVGYARPTNHVAGGENGSIVVGMFVSCVFS